MVCYHTFMFVRLVLIAMLLPLGADAQQSATPAPSAPLLPGLQPPGVSPFHLISPVVQPAFTPGMVELIDLEVRFAADVAKGGGKAFSTWFADDAVTLSDGKPAVFGRGAIAAQANWDPAKYSLTWTAQGAQMSASNEMGFTWGHYEGRTINAGGPPVVSSGRYITIWKKLPGGLWKVALDASANDASASDAPDPAACCTLPKP